jgi:hypothetical protein
MLRELFRVVSVVGVDGHPAPPEISTRFDGRAFTKHELEARGVRIAGREIWYLSNAQDWKLTLEPVA